jgi:hypothetical protein
MCVVSAGRWPQRLRQEYSQLPTLTALLFEALQHAGCYEPDRVDLVPGEKEARSLVLDSKQFPTTAAIPIDIRRRGRQNPIPMLKNFMESELCHAMDWTWQDTRNLNGPGSMYKRTRRFFRSGTFDNSTLRLLWIYPRAVCFFVCLRGEGTP